MRNRYGWSHNYYLLRMLFVGTRTEALNKVNSTATYQTLSSKRPTAD